MDLIRLVFNMAYGDFKDLKRRTFSDKVLRDKAFHITKSPKYDGYQRGIAIRIKQNLQLAKELHKPIIRNLKKPDYSGFKENIWGAD